MSVFVSIKKDKKLYKLFSDEGYFAFLYKSDMKDFGIDLPKSNDSDENDFQTEISLDESVIEKITELCVRRAFDKGADFISISEQCAYDIRFKLLRKGFPEEVIERAIALLYEYDYLNERRYAESYTRSYMNSKSRDVIVREIGHKCPGLDDIYGIVDQVYQDMDCDEDEVIKALIEKKFRGQDLSDERVRRRAMNLLIRHGFGFDKINKHLT